MNCQLTLNIIHLRLEDYPYKSLKKKDSYHYIGTLFSLYIYVLFFSFIGKTEEDDMS